MQKLIKKWEKEKELQKYIKKHPDEFIEKTQVMDEFGMFSFESTGMNENERNKQVDKFIKKRRTEWIKI